MEAVIAHGPLKRRTKTHLLGLDAWVQTRSQVPQQQEPTRLLLVGRVISLETHRPTFAIQNCAALSFQEFYDSIRLVILDAYFLQRRAEMLQEGIEVSVVQSRLQIRMDLTDVSTRVRFGSAKQSGNKHILVRPQMS